MFLNFSDKCVSYDTFIEDVAARVVHMLKESRQDAEVISQRRAYQIFGRANVERWRRLGKVEPYKRVGKVEYKTADLRRLQSVHQDYLE